MRDERTSTSIDGRAGASPHGESDNRLDNHEERDRPTVVVPFPPCATARAKQWIEARRVRERLFGAELFSDPAWDILLHAYLAHRTDESLSVEQLCRAIGVPRTTAVRWMAKLEEDGWLVRPDQHKERDRGVVRLSGRAVSTIEACLAATWP